MTYTQLKTQQCPPLDVLLSGRKYMSDLGYGMRQWFTEGCQKAMPTPEERAPDHPLAGVCYAGLDLCTSEGHAEPKAERTQSAKREDAAAGDAGCMIEHSRRSLSVKLAAPESTPPISSGEDAPSTCRFKARRGYSLQKDTDGTQLHVPDSPTSSSTREDCIDPEQVAAYCQARNIWTILGGDLNKPGAKQATKILRRIPREVYSGAVHTALKRSADMSVEEAIQYKRARILDIMSPKGQPQPSQHHRQPANSPAKPTPMPLMETPDAKKPADQAGDTDSPGSQSCVGECNAMRAALVTISA